MRHLDHSRNFDATQERPARMSMPLLCMPAMPPLGIMASIENRLRSWGKRNHRRTH